MDFLIAASALHLLLTRAPRLTQEVLDHPGTFVSLPVHPGPKSQISPGWRVSPMMHFTSLQSLRWAYGQGSIPPGIAVGYDNEHWQFTPAPEKAHPSASVRKFAALVHAHHDDYFQLGNLPVDGSPMGGARFAQAIDIQAQSAERDPERYRAIVLRDARTARRWNPHVLIFAGISTNPPPGTPVSLAALEQDVRAIRGTVNGYWLNVPAKGACCPRCGEQNVGLALRLLPWLQRKR